jgi:hypothetical protein
MKSSTLNLNYLRLVYVKRKVYADAPHKKNDIFVKNLFFLKRGVPIC